MIKTVYTIVSNEKIADGTYRMRLSGDTGAITAPGQFIDISVPELFLRRPISVCDWDGSGLTVIYKTVGRGTDAMSKMRPGDVLEALSGLGNGFDMSKCAGRTAVIGGGVGTPPLLGLAKRLAAAGHEVTAMLGFNGTGDMMLADEFAALGCRTLVATADGSCGTKGFVTELLPQAGFDSFCACGPLPMLRALCAALPDVPGQVSLEERMGCGFGACMGCTHKTKNGPKRVCKDGPVFDKEELIW